jgi:hypothetical protein
LTLRHILPKRKVRNGQVQYDVAKVCLRGFTRLLTRLYIILISKELVRARRTRGMRKIV